jgi:hypothetical protein
MTSAAEDFLEDVHEPRAHVHASVLTPGIGGDHAVPSLPSLAPAPGTLRVRIAVALARPGTLPDAQPMTFRQSHARHRECAAHTGGNFRMAYGWWHMTLVKAPLNYVEWGTQTPLGMAIHILLGLAVWLGLLAGGYL